MAELADKDDREVEAQQLRDEQPLTVKRLFEEMKKSAENAMRAELQTIALRNERFCHGRQDKDVQGADRTNLVSVVEGQKRSRYRNYLRKLVLTLSSRINEDRPDVFATPNEASGFDLSVVDVANAVIDYYHQQLDLDQMWFDAGVYCFMHTATGAKVTWDPLKGPKSKGFKDVDGTGAVVTMGQGEPTGEVSIDLVTIFDFATDGSEDIEHALWCYFRRFITKHEALELLRRAGYDDDTIPEEKSFPTLDWGEKRGVEVVEIWHRPSARIKEGLFATIVGGKVTEAMPFPYEHGQLPLCIWKAMGERDNPFGSSPITDGVPIQRDINDLVATIAEITERAGSGVKGVGVDSVVNQMRPGTHQIKVASVELVKNGYAYIGPPPPPPLLFSQLEEKKAELHDVVGLSEQLIGRSRDVLSGKAIAYLNKLDSQALAGAARSQESCQRRMWKQVLSLVQQFVVDTRLAKIVGVDGDPRAYKIVPFRGSDLSGVDVHLEPRTGMARYRQTAADEAQQEGAAGMLPPAEAAERGRTGLPETLGSALERRLVGEQVEGVLHGAAVDADPQIDPAIAVDEITRALTAALSGGRNPQDPVLQALQQLLDAYRQLAAQTQQPQAPQQMPQGGGAPPPAPAGPPGLGDELQG